MNEWMVMKNRDVLEIEQWSLIKRRMKRINNSTLKTDLYKNAPDGVILNEEVFPVDIILS